MDSASVNSPGEAMLVVITSSDPASPAHAALMTNASTRSLATFSPASAAATSSSRSARQLRPQHQGGQDGGPSYPGQPPGGSDGDAQRGGGTDGRRKTLGPAEHPGE